MNTYTPPPSTKRVRTCTTKPDFLDFGLTKNSASLPDIELGF